jgi:hypothetical protein
MITATSVLDKPDIILAGLVGFVHAAIAEINDPRVVRADDVGTARPVKVQAGTKDGVRCLDFTFLACSSGICKTASLLTHFQPCPWYEGHKSALIGVLNDPPFTKSRRQTMNRPLEYEERVRVTGFSILDDDFDLMTADLCGDAREELGVNRICESMRTVFKFMSFLWHGSTGLKSA